MHLRRYTVASFLLIAFVGWYVSTFVSSETVSINLFGIEIAPLSVSIWVMIPLVLLYIGSIIHMSFYSVVGSLNLRKYEKDYENIINSLSDAYIGKENRFHVFKTPRYKLLGYLVDNTTLFPSNINHSSIDNEKISHTIKIINDIKNGEVVDLKKFSLSIDNPLVIQNERNRYKSEEQSAEEFLSHSGKYNTELLKEIYVDFVKTSPLYAIESYKQFMSKESLFNILHRVNADENTLDVSNEALIGLFEELHLIGNDYIKMSEALAFSMIPEQRIKLFETLSNINEKAMEAYLYTLYDLEMMAPADAILELSQADEYLNFKAYRALKECNKNFNINLFVIDRIC